MGSFQLKIIIPFLPCSGCDIIEGGCITPSKLFRFRHQGSIFPYRFTGDPTQKGTRDDDIIPMKDFSYLVACRLRLLIYRHKLYMIGKSYYPACFCLHVGYSQHTNQHRLVNFGECSPGGCQCFLAIVYPLPNHVNSSCSLTSLGAGVSTLYARWGASVQGNLLGCTCVSPAIFKRRQKEGSVCVWDPCPCSSEEA